MEDHDKTRGKEVVWNVVRRVLNIQDNVMELQDTAKQKQNQ